MTIPETLPYLSRRELESMSISTDQVVSTIERLIRDTAIRTAGLSALGDLALATLAFQAHRQ